VIRFALGKSNAFEPGGSYTIRSLASRHIGTQRARVYALANGKSFPHRGACGTLIKSKRLGVENALAIECELG
jgi:hypothetical protein